MRRVVEFLLEVTISLVCLAIDIRLFALVAFLVLEWSIYHRGKIVTDLLRLYQFDNTIKIRAVCTKAGISEQDLDAARALIEAELPPEALQSLKRDFPRLWNE